MIWRHTAAALMVAAAAHREHIKRHLGHSSIMVTMALYGHLFPSEAEEIADRLDDMLRVSQTDKRRAKPLEVGRRVRNGRVAGHVNQGGVFRAM